MDAGDWVRLGWLANTQQGLMEALGLNTPELDRLLHCMRSCRGIHGAKISGAGRGDCVVGVGETPVWEAPFERLPVKASGEGLRREDA